MQQAMRIMFEGLPLASDSDDPIDEMRRAEIARLIRRLDGPVQPLEAIEIANAAVTVL